MSANSFKFLSIVYIREPGINKRKVIREKNTTKCRKHQRNLIIRKYQILLDVNVCDRYVGTDIFCNIGFLFKIIEI